MATTFQDSITFAGDVSVAGTLTATGIPTLNGATLTINADAAAGTDQDPALAMKGGDGGTEIIVITFGQDSSADKAFVKMQGGAAGTTEKSMALHVGAIATTAAVNSTLVLEAGASSTNKPASLVNTGSTGVLAITGTTGVTLDAGATIALCNATTNPTLSQLGTGQVSFAGNVNATNGLDVTVAALTAAAGFTVSGGVSAITGSDIDLDPTGHFTLDMDAAKTVTTNLADDLDAAYVVKQGTDQYIEVDTQNAGAKVIIGNAVTNPTFDVLGSGQITLTGNVDASAGLDVTGNITVTGTVDGRDIATDGTKLDTVETNADVTDAANVDAAGAVMNSDTSTAAMSFVIDEDNMATNSATKVPTQQSVKAYVDASVGATVYRQVLERDSGLAQASTNTTIIRFTNAVQAAGSGCFAFTDSATDGSYITASVNCVVTVAVTLNRASGTVWIKSAASLSNALNATDTDIKGVADFSVANEGAFATFYMAAGDKAWVASSAAPGGSYARLNRFMVSAVSV